MKFSSRTGVLLAVFFMGCAILLFGCNVPLLDKFLAVPSHAMQDLLGFRAANNHRAAIAWYGVPHIREAHDNQTGDPGEAEVIVDPENWTTG